MNKKQLKASLKPLVRECIQEVLSEMLVESTITRIVAEGVSRVLEENAPAVRQRQAPPPKKEMSVEELFQRNMGGSRLDERVTPRQPAPAMDVGGINVFEGLTPIGRGDSPEAVMNEQAAGAEVSEAALASLGLDFGAMQRAAGIEQVALQQARPGQNILEEQRLAQLRAALDVPANSPEARAAIERTTPKMPGVR